jgi:hypothetical protein
LEKKETQMQKKVKAEEKLLNGATDAKKAIEIMQEGPGKTELLNKINKEIENRADIVKRAKKKKKDIMEKERSLVNERKAILEVKQNLNKKKSEQLIKEIDKKRSNKKTQYTSRFDRLKTKKQLLSEKEIGNEVRLGNLSREIKGTKIFQKQKLSNIGKAIGTKIGAKSKKIGIGLKKRYNQKFSIKNRINRIKFDRERKKLGVSMTDLNEKSSNKNLQEKMYQTRLKQKGTFWRKLDPADREAFKLFQNEKNIEPDDATSSGINGIITQKLNENENLSQKEREQRNQTATKLQAVIRGRQVRKAASEKAAAEKAAAEAAPEDAAKAAAYKKEQKKQKEKKIAIYNAQLFKEKKRKVEAARQRPTPEYKRPDLPPAFTGNAPKESEV